MAEEAFPLTETQQSVIYNYGESFSDSAQQVSFTPPTEQTEQVSFTPQGTASPPSPELASKRSEKAAFATGKPVSDVSASITAGREEALRNSVAAEDDLQWKNTRFQVINKIVQDANAKGTPLSPEEYDILGSMTREEWKTDPKTIFEKKFAEKYIRDKVIENKTTEPTGIWAKAFKENPEATIVNMRLFQEQGTKVGIINTLNEELHEETKQRGWPAAIGGTIWGALTQWPSHAMLLQEAPWSITSLPGTIKREQISYLLSLPMPAFEVETRKAINELKGRSLDQAREFAEALKGFSTSDQFLMSAGGLLDLSLLPIGRTAGAIGRAAGRASERLIPTREIPETVSQFRLDPSGLKPIHPPATTIDLTKLPPIKEVVQDVVRHPIKRQEYQMDLWLGDPRQGQLFPLQTAREGGAGIPPPLGAGLPPGRLRSTYVPLEQQTAESIRRESLTGRNLVTGRLEPGVGRYRQGELPLEGGGQGTFNFDPRTSLPSGGPPPPTPGAPLGPLGGPQPTITYTYPSGNTVKITPEQARGEIVDSVAELRRIKAIVDNKSLPQRQRDSALEGLGQLERTMRDLQDQLAKIPSSVSPTAPPVNILDRVDQQIAYGAYVKGIDHADRAAAQTATGGRGSGNGSGLANAAGESGNSAAAAVHKDMFRRTPLWQNAVMRPVDLDLLPSAYNHQAQAFWGNNGSLANQKAIERAVTRDMKLEAVADEAMRIRRLPDEVEAKAAEATRMSLLREYGPKLGDAILDVVHLPSQLMRSNVGMGVLRLGDNRTKLPFTSRDQAELFAKDVYKLDPNDYNIYVNGSEFYIGVRANVAENTDRTLNYLADIIRRHALPGLLSTLNKFKMVDSYLDPASSAQRKVAAHAQQGMKAMVKETADVFTSLGRKQAREVETVINDYGNKRQWFETANDFKQAFMNRHKYAPTDAQIEAAYTYKQLQDHDYMIRNFGMYRDMARQGAEQWTLHTRGGEAAYFNAIEMEKLPWGRGEDFTIAVYKAGDDAATVGFAHQAERAQGKLNKSEIDDMITKGGKVLQVFDPNSRPLSGMKLTDTHVNYIVTDAAKSKPLSWHQLKYEPGPHSIYPYEWYVKQGKISEGHLGKLFYYGDNTLWNFSTEAEAKQWLSRLETARQMVKAGDAGAEAYITKNLPYNSLKEFLKLKSHFDFDVPFAITQRGKSVFESQLDLEKQFPGVLNFHKSSHNPQNFMDRTFLQERDELLQNPALRAGQPVFEQGKQLDAFDALERGLNQSIRNMWLNDEKVRAVTEWIEKFRSVIDVTNPDQLRATPLWFLYNGNLKKTASSVESKAMEIAAEQERRAIINFVGQQTEFGNAVGMWKTALMDSIYKVAGKDAADYSSDFALGFIRDPSRYMRSFAANMKIGLFNPIPMFQQAMTFMNVAAIAPQHTLRAGSAAYLLEAGSFTADPAILNRAAKMAESFGWRSKDFLEMNQAFRMTNLNYVGKEAAFRADNFDPHLFKSATGPIFDKGFMFFNTGERLTRKASFAASYAEWRAANPTAKMTEQTIAQIQQRADTMTGHMTSASLSNFQQGGLQSVMLQFTTYYNHMAQLMLGKELSVMEKTRLIGLNSALFGIPAGIGIGGLPSGIAAGVTSAALSERPIWQDAVAGVGGMMGMWPIYDDIMEYAKANNKDWFTPMYAQAAMKGMINVAFQIMTGKDPDVAKNYALGMNGYLRDIIRNDKKFFEVLAGASGGVIGDVLNSMYPITMKTSRAIMGEGEFANFNKSDFERVARNISTFDLADKVWASAAYGKYLSKREVAINNMDAMDTFLTALRLSPKQAQESYLIMNIDQNQKHAQEKFENLALEQMRRANNAMKEGNYDQYVTFMNDANKYIELGDFGYAKRVQIRQRAIDEAKGFEENMQRRYLRNAPRSQQENMNRFPQHFRTNP